jgi:hypothetical protein
MSTRNCCVDGYKYGGNSQRCETFNLIIVITSLASWDASHSMIQLRSCHLLNFLKHFALYSRTLSSPSLASVSGPRRLPSFQKAPKTKLPSQVAPSFDSINFIHGDDIYIRVLCVPSPLTIKSSNEYEISHVRLSGRSLCH